MTRPCSCSLTVSRTSVCAAMIRAPQLRVPNYPLPRTHPIISLVSASSSPLLSPPLVQCLQLPSSLPCFHTLAALSHVALACPRSHASPSLCSHTHANHCHHRSTTGAAPASCSAIASHSSPIEPYLSNAGFPYLSRRHSSPSTPYPSSLRRARHRQRLSLLQPLRAPCCPSHTEELQLAPTMSMKTASMPWTT